MSWDFLFLLDSSFLHYPTLGSIYHVINQTICSINAFDFVYLFLLKNQNKLKKQRDALTQYKTICHELMISVLYQ